MSRSLRPLRLASAVASLLCAAALQAQTRPSPSAEVEFSKARSLYYTPVDAGLRGFHCEVTFDWKAFLQKASNQPVADTDERLAYLRTIQLSVDDTLRGTGELHWQAPSPAPEGAEDSVGKIRDGIQGLWAGFFQSWNGFITGDMMTEDAKATFEHTPAGFHLSARNGPGLAEEQYDNKLLLQTVHVTTPNLDSLQTPTFSPSARGLLITGLKTTYRQPPSSPPTDVAMQISYAPVGAFELPSELQITVGPAGFDFRLANCTVDTQITQ